MRTICVKGVTDSVVILVKERMKGGCVLLCVYV